MENNTIMSGSGQNNGFFSISAQETIKVIRNAILKSIVWVLVGSVILGVICILLAGNSGMEAVGKFNGTLFILTGAALVSVVDFRVIECGRKSAQAFAILGIFMNILWALLWILAMWDLFDIWACHNSYSCSGAYSVPGVFTMIATYLSGLGLFGGYTLSLYEGNKRSTIRPLKITSVACLIYLELYSIINLFTGSKDHNYGDDRFAMLAYFSGIVWFVVMIIAIVMSKREQDAETLKKDKVAEEKKKEEESKPAKKTDEELRAEIEEKVRREIIEKEVREKLEKEMAEKKPE